MKKLLLTTAALISLSTATLAQEATVSGHVAATTDYRVRGISRSDEGLSVNGGVKIKHPIGVYGGVDAATVDLRTDSDADVEAVLFAGYQTKFDGADLDARVTYNAYPGANNNDLDYFEFVGTGGYDFDVFYGMLTWAVSPNYMNDSGMSFYYGADVDVPLPNTGYDLTAKGHLGFQFNDDNNNYSNDYTEWSLGLWYNWAQYDVDFGLEYVDTDLDSIECVEKCGARGVLSVSKDFGW